MNNLKETVQPTHRKETLLSLAYLSHIFVSSHIESFVTDLCEAIPQHTTYFKDKSNKKTGDKHFNSQSAGLCILNDSLETLNKHCSFDFLRTVTDNPKEIVIADFCNNGLSPLETFKELNFEENVKELFHFIEFEQAKSTIAHESIKESLLDCSFPSLSVSLGLFRPKDNELEQLQALIDKNIMAPLGKLIIVIRKESVEDIKSLLTTHFKIFEVSKAFDDDYCFMICEKLSLPTTNSNGLTIITNVLKKNKALSMKSFKRLIPLVDLDARKYELDAISNQNKLISDPNDKVWDAFKSMVALGTKKQDKIITPKAPKQGELSLFIASGTINGELELASGEGKHIVLGGVEALKDTEEKTSYSKSGSSFESTVVTKSSRPFLNLLVNNKGKLMIKKLQDN